MNFLPADISMYIFEFSEEAFLFMFPYEALKYFKEKAAILAVQYNSLEYLKYILRNSKYRSEDHICESAAESGSFECLKYAHENNYPWNERTTANAAGNGHFKCLKYAFENNCPWNEETYSRAIDNNHNKCFKYAYNKLLKLRSNNATDGCELGESTRESLMLADNIICLEYIYQNDYNWLMVHRTYMLAELYNACRCFKFVIAHGCPDIFDSEEYEETNYSPEENNVFYYETDDEYDLASYNRDLDGDDE